MPTASEFIEQLIASTAGWRGARLAELRETINGADGSLQEDWKWGTPVWVSNGNVCAISAFKDHVKVNFFKGASLADPRGILNAGQEAKLSRAIDLAEADEVDTGALQDLVRQAVALNKGGRR